jgi:(p)ppGpp synthase/HD superfamily hydrolase
MHPFAQTNIQLINQLRASGYPPPEIGTVVTSYELAMRLFTGLFRASGKTFVAHLVGTASILGSLRTSSNLVAAGLLHAAYASGDFGDGKNGMTEVKREWMRSAVGSEIEAYVAGYTKLVWTEEAAAAISDGIAAFAPFDRDVLLIRLANELEELLDLGILYCGDGRRRFANNENLNALTIRLAEQLSFPALALRLGEAFREAAGAEIPPGLRAPQGRDISFLVAPQSYQRVMDAVAKRLKQ